MQSVKCIFPACATGNIVEWKFPSEVVLEGVEFKSMASGLHKITKDFMYAWGEGGGWGRGSEDFRFLKMIFPLSSGLILCFVF